MKSSPLSSVPLPLVIIIGAIILGSAAYLGARSFPRVYNDPPVPVQPDMTLRDLPLYSIEDIKQQDRLLFFSAADPSGPYQTIGYVNLSAVTRCGQCPVGKNVVCAPCPPSYIIIGSESHPYPRGAAVELVQSDLSVGLEEVLSGQKNITDDSFKSGVHYRFTLKPGRTGPVLIDFVEEFLGSESSVWKTYRNEKYGFEFKYPFQWVEHSDCGGNCLISFGQKGTGALAGVKFYFHANASGGSPIKTVSDMMDVVVGRYRGSPEAVITSRKTPNDIEIVQVEGLPGIVDNESVAFALLDTGMLEVYPGNWINNVSKIDGIPVFEEEEQPVRIDFARCDKTQETFFVAFGSTVISVEGIEGDSCVLRYGEEVENPEWDFTLDTVCRVPRSLGIKTFYKGDQGVDMSSIAPYCAKEVPPQGS